VNRRLPQSFYGSIRGGIDDDGVEAVLSQQLIQPTIEGMTRVAVTHIAGCRSRFRLPIDMGDV
jgi:hypothetical protein